MVGAESAPATRAQAVSAVVALLDLATPPPAAPTYADVPTTAAAFGAIEAGAQAGLMAGWAPSSGNFDPTAVITRIQLAVLATNAMNLQAKAASLIGDTVTFGYLGDLGAAGYDLGDANVALEEGVVPPIDTTRFAPFAPVTQTTLAVALYRLYLTLDLPQGLAVTPFAASILPNAADGLGLSVTNRLGRPLSAAALARYAPTYSVTGPNASTGLVSAGSFSATATGLYTLAAQLTGPFMANPLTAQTTVSVYLPPPPPAPTGVTAVEVRGGIAVSWTGVSAATGYQVYEAIDGSATYAPVSQADGGSVAGAATTTATVSGLQVGAIYTFEVAALGRFGRSTSAASAVTPFGADASVVALQGAAPATGSIALSNEDFGALATTPLAMASDPTTAATTLSWNTGSVVVPQGTIVGGVCPLLDPYFSCVPGSNGVTLASLYPGVGGNMPIVSSAPSQIGSGSFTGGGVGADTITIAGQTLTADSGSFPATNTTYSDAMSLEASINNDSSTLGVSAYLSGSTVNVVAGALGPAGNAITLDTNNTSDVTLNGTAQASTTLTGGTNGSLTVLFTQAMDTSTVTDANLATALTLSGGQSFGTGATAAWSNVGRTLTVTLGSGARFMGGDTLSFAPGVTDATGNQVAGPIVVPLLQG